MRKNIGILIWSLRDGGAERAAANLSRELSQYYNVHMMLFDARNIAYAYKGTLYDIGLLPASAFLGKCIYLIRRCWRIYAYKKKHHIDTVISFMPNANLYNVLTRGRGKAIISIRNTMSASCKSKRSRWMISWCGKMADKTVCVSEVARQDLIAHFAYPAHKAITIRNFCDTSITRHTNPKIEQIISKFDFSGGVVSTVGRLNLQKAQWHLLRAFSLVQKKLPKSKLVILGQGELETALKEYAQKLKISSQVFFMGYVKNHHAFLKKCNLFVLPSFFEGISNALLEAMSCGLPVVATECSSEVLSQTRHQVQEVEYSDYGILVPNFSAKTFDIEDLNFEPADYTLAHAMEQMLTDQNLDTHYRQKALQRIEDFSPQKITQQWVELIENL